MTSSYGIMNDNGINCYMGINNGTKEMAHVCYKDVFFQNIYISNILYITSLCLVNDI